MILQIEIKFLFLHYDFKVVYKYLIRLAAFHENLYHEERLRIIMFACAQIIIAVFPLHYGFLK